MWSIAYLMGQRGDRRRRQTRGEDIPEAVDDVTPPRAHRERAALLLAGIGCEPGTFAHLHDEQPDGQQTADHEEHPEEQQRAHRELRPLFILEAVGVLLATRPADQALSGRRANARCWRAAAEKPLDAPAQQARPANR